VVKVEEEVLNKALYFNRVAGLSGQKTVDIYISVEVFD